MPNDFPIPPDFEAWSEVNTPGLVAIIDGDRYALNHAKWTLNSHGATDTLTVVVPLSTNPDFPTQLFRGTLSEKPSAEEIAAADLDVLIDLYAGFRDDPGTSPISTDGLVHQFTGEVDRYSGMFGKDTVTFTSRSLGAHLVDDTLTNISVNQTISDFIRSMSKKYGLPTPVITLIPGTTPATIGQLLAYDQISGASANPNETFSAAVYKMHPMDLIIRGTQLDDTDAWVDAPTGAINYVTPTLVTRNDITLKYGRDWTDDISVDHSIKAAKNIVVKAYSHQKRTRTTSSVSISDDGFGNVTVNQRSGYVSSQAVMGTNQLQTTSTTITADGKKSVTNTSSASSGGNASATAAASATQTRNMVYPLYLDNLPLDKVLSAAQNLRRQISQRQYLVKGTIPITRALVDKLSITSRIHVNGAPWGLVNDQYYSSEIEFEAGVDVGYKATITMVNHILPSGSV
jgi:hypothetical protein